MLARRIFFGGLHPSYKLRTWDSVCKTNGGPLESYQANRAKYLAKSDAVSGWGGKCKRINERQNKSRTKGSEKWIKRKWNNKRDGQEICSSNVSTRLTFDPCVVRVSWWITPSDPAGMRLVPQCVFLTARSIFSSMCAPYPSFHPSLHIRLITRWPSLSSSHLYLDFLEQTVFHLPLCPVIKTRLSNCWDSHKSNLSRQFLKTNKLFSCRFCTPEIYGMINLWYPTEYGWFVH